MNRDAVERSASALLALVATDRRARLERIEAAAAGTAAAELRAARGAARRRVHEALAHERARLRERLDALAARLATGRRLARQRHLRAELEVAWRELPRALAARWASPASRRAWVRGTLAAAAAALGTQDWRILHAPGLADEEREALVAELARQGIGAPRFVEDAALEAGLSVRVGSNTLDATLRGLLLDRAALGARLAEALADAEGSA